jgi:hypothetical protein
MGILVNHLFSFDCLRLAPSAGKKLVAVKWKWRLQATAASSSRHLALHSTFLRRIFFEQTIGPLQKSSLQNLSKTLRTAHRRLSVNLDHSPRDGRCVSTAAPILKEQAGPIRVDLVELVKRRKDTERRTFRFDRSAAKPDAAGRRRRPYLLDVMEKVLGSVSERPSADPRLALKPLAFELVQNRLDEPRLLRGLDPAGLPGLVYSPDDVLGEPEGDGLLSPRVVARRGASLADDGSDFLFGRFFSALSFRFLGDRHALLSSPVRCLQIYSKLLLQQNHFFSPPKASL